MGIVLGFFIKRTTRKTGEESGLELYWIFTLRIYGFYLIIIMD